jgi:hypothetical protein
VQIAATLRRDGGGAADGDGRHDHSDCVEMADAYGFCGAQPLSPFFDESGNMTPCFLYLFSAGLQALYLVTFGVAEAVRVRRRCTARASARELTRGRGLQLYMARNSVAPLPPWSRRTVHVALQALSWGQVALTLALLITSLAAAPAGDGSTAAVQPYRTVALGVVLGTWIAASLLLAADQVRGRPGAALDRQLT